MMGGSGWCEIVQEEQESDNSHHMQEKMRHPGAASTSYGTLTSFPSFWDSASYCLVTSSGMEKAQTTRKQKSHRIVELV